MNAMNFDQARFNMVEQQIRTWDVLDPEVLELMLAVKREDFVPAAYRNLAFSDTEIPLGHGAKMLAPKIEAHILQAVQIRRHDKVLEVGTGSGCMAALLAARADYVWTVEIVPELARMARDKLARAGVDNVEVIEGDGLVGLPAEAPFDVIVVSGAVPELPQELLAQLKIKGRLFAVVGTAPVMEARLVTRVAEDAYSQVNLFETMTTTLAHAPRPKSFSF